MMKIVVILFMIKSLLYSSEYSDVKIAIFAKILPRVILMSSQKERIVDSLNICLIRDELDSSSAKLLADKIYVNYPKSLLKKDINIESVTFNELDKCKSAHLLFMFDTREELVSRVVDFSNSYGVLSAAYNDNYLESGLQLSIFIGRKVTPYINISAINRSNIELDNLLLRISKIYYENR